MSGQSRRSPRGRAFFLSALLWAASLAGLQGPALAAGEAARTLVPVGHTIGIKLFSEGVVVVGLAEVETGGGLSAPGAACGLQVGDVIGDELTLQLRVEGDVIEEANGSAVESSEQFARLLQCGGTVELAVSRDGVDLTLAAEPALGPDGTYRLGAWIRDSMAGIGTVTFYDPATGAFGALGHGITDSDTGLLMPLGDGAVMDASVKAVKKGSAGDPGELRGSFNLTEDMGSLWANTERGVFGVLDQCDFAQGQAVAVAAPDQVHTGPAEILSNISGDAVETFDVELVRVVEDSGTQNLLIRVTDPALIARTGGIVQGMSGSPILQDGRLVGAVTHVMIDDPTKGYGILIENMLAQAEKAEPTLG